jgi:hypothetical protein
MDLSDRRFIQLCATRLDGVGRPPFVGHSDRSAAPERPSNEAGSLAHLQKLATVPGYAEGD